jgi:hypothetical protein
MKKKIALSPRPRGGTREGENNMKLKQPSKLATLAVQRIRTLLDGPDNPKLAVRMAQIIDEEIERKLLDQARSAAKEGKS